MKAIIVVQRPNAESIRVKLKDTTQVNIVEGQTGDVLFINEACSDGTFETITTHYFKPNEWSMVAIHNRGAY